MASRGTQVSRSRKNAHQNPSESIQKTKKKDVSKLELDPEKEFLKTFHQLTQYHRGWDVWHDFVIMVACALSNPLDKIHYSEREARYLRIINKYDKQEQEWFIKLFTCMVMALELNPNQDFLGKLYTSLGLCDKGKEQYFTPYHICEFMAEVMLDDIAASVKQDGFTTISDCCCGAGAILIASVHKARKALQKINLNFQNHILIAAQDIDETAALMCYIQLSLLGVAGYIKVGNALTEPMCATDTLENYWFTPMCFSDIWILRQIIRQVDVLTQGKSKVES